jgi:LmbE family N-acetylglucosaminyl deacetylase
MTAPALFVSPHPDDETIGMAVPIAEHLAAGQDVWILELTDGEATGVTGQLNGIGVNPWWGIAHDPTDEGYTPLTAADVGAARLREAAAAAHILATGYPGILTICQAHLPDGAVSEASAERAILAVADQANPAGPVRLKGPTWVPELDDHPDHIATGQAIRSLGTADPVRFGDRRYYVQPGHWTTTPPAGITLWWDTPDNPGIAAHAIAATRCYAAWSPAAGSYAIGMHSKSDWLTTIATTPKARVHS